jgi:hypothetical protein
LSVELVIKQPNLTDLFESKFMGKIIIKRNVKKDTIWIDKNGNQISAPGTNSDQRVARPESQGTGAESGSTEEQAS